MVGIRRAGSITRTGACAQPTSVDAVEYVARDVPVHYVEHGAGFAGARPARRRGRPPRGDGLPGAGVRCAHRIPPDLPGPPGHGADPGSGDDPQRGRRPRCPARVHRRSHRRRAAAGGRTLRRRVLRAGDRRPTTGAGGRAGAAVPAAGRHPRRARNTRSSTARATSATPSSATTSPSRPPRPWIDTSGTSSPLAAWPTSPPSRGSVSGGNSALRQGTGSVPTPDAAGDRSPGLHGRLRRGPGSCSSTIHAPPSPCLTGPVMRSHTNSPSCSRALVTEWLDRVEEARAASRRSDVASRRRGAAQVTAPGRGGAGSERPVPRRAVNSATQLVPEVPLWRARCHAWELVHRLCRGVVAG